MPLPNDPVSRKALPLYRALFKFFPDAIVEVCACSMAGQRQHVEGEEIVWKRDKSNDHLDSALRHILEAGTVDSDGVRHTAKAAWRLLAELQIEIERARDSSETKPARAPVLQNSELLIRELSRQPQQR